QGTYSDAYDALGRRSSQQDPWGLTLAFAYDATGNTTSVTDSLGGVTSSVYDADGRLTSRTLSGQGQTPLRLDTAYPADSQVAGLSRYSDLAATQLVGRTIYGYDVLGQATSIEHKDGWGATLQALGSSYDLAARVTASDLLKDTGGVGE